MNINDIKDPKLRRRIEDAMHNVKTLETEIERSIPKHSRKRIRQDSKPLMNQLEQEYYDQYLSKDYGVCIQSVRFRLANGLWYKTDFFCPGSPPIGIEVKGEHAFRGGFENLKVAAGLWPEVRWILVWKDNGAWCQQEVLP